MAFTFDGGTTTVDMTSIHEGDVVIYSDTDANDQDKTFTATVDMDVLGIRIEFVAFAAAATRVVRYEWLNSDSDIIMSHVLSIAPTTGQIHAFEISPDVDITAGTEGALTDSFFERGPQMRLRIGHALHFVSTSGNAGDDMTVHIRGIAR